MSRPSSGPQKNRFGWIVFIMVCLGTVIYVYTSGDDTPPAKPKVSTKGKTTTNGTSDFIPADYTYKFADEKIAPKGDAFLPLVSKLTVGGGSGDTGPEDLPQNLTGGEPWAYTGMVQVNGATQAVLENQKTSDTVFLTVGQQWKKAKVKRVSDSAIELADSSGKVYTVKMSEASAKNDATVSATNAAQGANAASPALTGPINPSGLDVTPLPGIQTSPTFNGGGGGGGGWRRRNRGGFGGGGYGGGGGG